MRNLFIVLAKVVGLLQIPTALNYSNFLFIFVAETINTKASWQVRFKESYPDIIVSIVGISLVLSLAWVLLFRTTWITSRVGIPEGEMHLPERNPLLYIGIKLLGLFVLVGAVPGFLSVLINSRVFNPDTTVSYFLNRIFPIVLKLVFGFLLIIKTTKIMELISTDAKPKDIVSA
jgi:hypothetical protein